MKKLNQKILAILVGLLFFSFLISCDEKVESPIMEYDYVYFTDAAKGTTTLDAGSPDTGIPAIPNSLGFFEQALKYSKDTTINLGVFCSGTQMPKGDIRVTIEVDKSMLDSLTFLGSGVNSLGKPKYPNYVYKNYQVLKYSPLLGQKS